MDVIEYVFNEVAKLHPDHIRAYILGLEHEMLNDPSALKADDLPVRHVFSPGMYARELFMPAGTVIIGKIHRHAHMNTISKGKIQVLTPNGTATYTAPFSFVSEPGMKRVGRVLEDTVWTTYHKTDKTDLAEIEQDVIAPSFSDIELVGEYIELEEMRCLG